MSEKIVCTVPGLKLINELKAELLEEQSLESKYFFSGGDKNLPKNKKDNVLNSLIFKHQPTTKTSIFGEPIISENNVVREKNENNLTITMLKKPNSSITKEMLRKFTSDSNFSMSKAFQTKKETDLPDLDITTLSRIAIRNSSRSTTKINVNKVRKAMIPSGSCNIPSLYNIYNYTEMNAVPSTQILSTLKDDLRKITFTGENETRITTTASNLPSIKKQLMLTPLPPTPSKALLPTLKASSINMNPNTNTSLLELSPPNKMKETLRLKYDEAKLEKILANCHKKKIELEEIKQKALKKLEERHEVNREYFNKKEAFWQDFFNQKIMIQNFDTCSTNFIKRQDERIICFKEAKYKKNWEDIKVGKHKGKKEESLFGRADLKEFEKLLKKVKEEREVWKNKEETPKTLGKTPKTVKVNTLTTEEKIII